VKARGLLQSLVGRRLQTVTGRENRVLGCDRETVVVWTARSPAGQRVPIAWVQDALDRLERDREIEISVQSVGYRSAFIGAVLREVPGAEVVRSVSPPRVRLTRAAKATASRREATVVLLGCVKTKLDRAAPAKDLYRSRLWRWRRAYAEASGRPWLILSAMHGLVEPEAQLDPYDLALAQLTAGEREEWGERVVRALVRHFGELDGMTFEVHAGADYRRAVEPGIRALGGQLRAPLHSVPLGAQPAWYQSRLAMVGQAPTMRRQRSTTGQLRAAMRALDDAPNRISARDWPDGLESLDRAGLYSWWVDEQGASDLSEGLGQVVLPGRIYAGQTGATKWPSGKAGKATLASRIGANHLRGNIRGSTFRLTLASCLVSRLSLFRTARRRLDSPSERRLSAWICDHLEIAVLPLADRDRLGDLEHRVLLELDPPLNLDGMPMNPLRHELSRRRATLV
jgi:hypothetical protein